MYLCTPVDLTEIFIQQRNMALKHCMFCINVSSNKLGNSKIKTNEINSVLEDMFEKCVM